MKPRDAAMLFLLAAIWGSSFLFIRLAVVDFPPPLLALIRVFGGAAVLLFIVRLVLRQVITRHNPSWHFLVLGLFNAALPFTFIAFAEQALPASFAAILNASTPLFTAIIASFWLKDPLTRRKVIGLMMGLFGVALVVGWSPFEMTPIVIGSIAAMIAASFSYGIGTVYAKANFAGNPPLTMAIGQQLGAGIVLIPLAATNIPTHSPSTTATLALLALAVMCTAFAYLLYFTLIRRIGATSTSSVTLLVPFFGILWGGIFLGETVEIGQLVGFAVILSSLSLVTGIGMTTLERLFNRKPVPAS